MKKKTIDVIIVSYNRVNDLKEALDSILFYKNDINKIFIIDNNSQDETKEWLLSINDKKITVIILDINMGVAGGRNIGIMRSTADIVMFIDDDAILNCKQVNPFKKVLENFEDHSLGIVAFKIINYYSNKILRHEFPFVDKNIDNQKPRRCAYYIGAGHAISRSVFQRSGLYPDDYFYGKEELDLSLKAINAGFEIVYEPSIEVLHKQSPTGRQTNDEKWKQVYRNRLVISYKYYPFIYAIISNILWFFKILLLSKSVFVPIAGYTRYLNVKHTLNKNKLTQKALLYIKRNSGRLF
ncbi:glycosyltransferase family 2 protein [Campylobacter curvus]|nr:glycosyltransferase [Campylobacter curvus]MBN7288360.1 glycosyltransferase [Campylobacter curvus]